MKSISIKSLQQEYEQGYFMYIGLAIILSSCIGSIAAMTILAQGTTLISGIELSICVSLCMGYNAAVLSGVNKKISFWLLVVGLAVNILLILITLL